jgi:hypothetical protein
MRRGDSPLSAEQIHAAKRVVEGEDPTAVARDFNVDVSEVLRWKNRIEAIIKKEAARESRQAHRGQPMRETEVEDRVRRFLAGRGYVVRSRSKPTGADILAERQGKILLVEVKGDRPGHDSSPGTINVDVMTLLGQILMAKAVGDADEYAIAIRPVHTRLIERAMPVLKELGVGVMLVKDDVRMIGAPENEMDSGVEA